MSETGIFERTIKKKNDKILFKAFILSVKKFTNYL